MKSILGIKVIKDKKISKFYAYIMIHFAKQNQNRKIKELITKTALLNLINIQHDIAFFNILALLKNYKNTTKINYQDILDGEIIELLLETYMKRQNHV